MHYLVLTKHGIRLLVTQPSRITGFSLNTPDLQIVIIQQVSGLTGTDNTLQFLQQILSNLNKHAGETNFRYLHWIRNPTKQHHYGVCTQATAWDSGSRCPVTAFESHHGLTWGRSSAYKQRGEKPEILTRALRCCSPRSPELSPTPARHPVTKPSTVPCLLLASRISVKQD